MGSSNYYRTLSPTGGRHHHGARASTGMVQLGSSVDPYETPRGRYDYDDYYYPSDVGYSASYRHRPSHSSRLQAQPVSSQKYRDPGQPAKKRTEYTLQPQPRSRHRSHTASAADLYDTPVRLVVPSSGHLRPVVTSGRGRSPSPLPSTSDRYLVPSSTHHGKGHRRVYSTDYASDTGRLDPRNSVRHHSPQHGAYHAYPHSAHRRYAPYDGLKNGDDMDDYEAYSYTTPREQFDRDYPVRPHHPRGRSSVDRPLSMNVMEEHPSWVTRKDRRHHGPPPTSWGFDKIDREGRPRTSSRGVDDYREGSRPSGHERALVAVPHDSDADYDSYSDSRRRRHHRKLRHHHSRRHRDDPSPRPHNGSGEQVLPALGTAALGAGYSDLSDYDHGSARRHRRRPRDSERDHDPSHRSSRDLHDGAQDDVDRSKRLLVPRDHRRRRSRRRSERQPDSDSDVDTDDEDLRKYRREPSAAPRSRHSSTDTNSAEEHSSRRDRSHRSSRSQRQLEDGHPDESRHSSFADSNEDMKKLVAVDPPAAKEPEVAPKGILKPPRESFPEEPNPVREGVAPLKDAHKKGIPPGARWTKIGRRLVNPAALEAGNERYEERADYVIVLRVLTKEEIEAYALKTQEIRGKTLLGMRLSLQATHMVLDARHKERIEDKRRRMEEDQRHGRRGQESSSDDEDDSGEQPLQLEAPPAPEPEQQQSLPVRSHESNMPPPEHDRGRLSPSNVPAW